MLCFFPSKINAESEEPYKAFSGVPSITYLIDNLGLSGTLSNHGMKHTFNFHQPMSNTSNLDKFKIYTEAFKLYHELERE